ncbi:MAG: CBS domain-containing protein [Candidatus Brocadiales bacterium]|nr:CBS domain-containing protein [Candidatus Brocadiales bacterium]
MKVKNCMSTNVIVLKPEDNLRTVASLFVSKKLRAAPVVDREKHVVGIISIMDILGTFSPDFLPLLRDIDFIKDYGALDIRVKDVKELQKVKVADIMTKNVISVKEDSDLMVTIALMRKHGFRHLPVLKDSKLVGIVSYTDLLRRFLEVWEGKTRGED